MPRPTRRIFRLIVVEAVVLHDFDDGQGAVAHHRAGQFAAGNEGLDQHGLVERPFGRIELLRRVLVLGGDDEDADRGSFGIGLDHIGPGNEMFARRLAPMHPHPAGHRHAGLGQHALGHGLVHGER